MRSEYRLALGLALAEVLAETVSHDESEAGFRRFAAQVEQR